MSPIYSGVIRFEVDKVSTLNMDGRDSPQVEVGGVPWKLNVCKMKQVTGEGSNFSMFLLNLHKQSTPWNIDLTATYELVNVDSGKNVIVLKKPVVFDETHAIWGGRILDWNDFINEEKGFVKDDKITVEVRFSAHMKGIRIAPRIDFADPNEPLDDVTLMIGGEKIYASKHILSSHSPVFKAMFYGDFDDKHKKEIDLKNVDREEFIEMLRVVYPSCKYITDDSAEYLLKIGDQFEITLVIERAELHLISSSKVSNIEKLRIAEKYRMYGLVKHSLSTFKTAKDFKEVKESPIYHDLSVETTRALFEGMLKIAE